MEKRGGAKSRLLEAGASKVVLASPPQKSGTGIQQVSVKSGEIPTLAKRRNGAKTKAFPPPLTTAMISQLVNDPTDIRVTSGPRRFIFHRIRGRPEITLTI